MAVPPRPPAYDPTDPPPVAPPYGPRIYARVRTAEFTCPVCGRMAHVTNRHTRHWDPVTGVYRCACRRAWFLGLVLWEVGKSTRGRPADQVPTPGEALQLRMMGSYAPTGRIGPRRQRVSNLRCLCGVKCPVHHPTEVFADYAGEDPYGD